MYICRKLFEKIRKTFEIEVVEITNREKLSSCLKSSTCKDGLSREQTERSHRPIYIILLYEILLYFFIVAP